MMKTIKLLIAFLVLASAVLCGCAGKSVGLMNPSFDNGIADWKTDSWNNTGKTTFSSEVVGSRGGVALVTASVPDDARLIQEIKVEPDTVYKLSCDVRTKNVTGDVGANIGVNDVAVCSRSVTGTNDWQRIELVGRTAQGQNTLGVSVGIGTYGGLGSGVAYFDNVSVEKVNSQTGVVLGKASSSIETVSSDPDKLPTDAFLIYTSIASIILGCILIAYKYFAVKPVKLGKGRYKNSLLSIDNGRGFVGSGEMYAILILLAALGLRILVAERMFSYSNILGYQYAKLGGHKTDINCFTSWGSWLSMAGAHHFYDRWCDYPPGYMIILGWMADISKALGGGEKLYVFLVKLPCIIADLACAYIIWRLAKKRMNKTAALFLMGAAAYTPVFVYVSAAWGQIDQVLALFLILPILLLYIRRPILAGLMLGIAVALKPQALMCGPLFAAACVLYIIKGDVYGNPFLERRIPKLLKIKKDTALVRGGEIFFAVLAAFAVLIIISIPFRGDITPVTSGSDSFNIYGLSPDIEADEGDTVNVTGVVGRYLSAYHLRVGEASEVVRTEDDTRNHPDRAAAEDPLASAYQHVSVKEAVSYASGRENVSVTGTVTLISGNDVFIQDSTGGICLRFDSGTGSIRLGDNVIAVGTSGRIDELPALYVKDAGDTSCLTVLSSGNALPLQNVSLKKDLKPNPAKYLCTRIRITDVELGPVSARNTFWLLKKYLNTATSYKYATVNGFNFWGLVGANWKSTEELFYGLSYGKWGTIFMAFFVAAGIGLYVFAMLRKSRVPSRPSSKDLNRDLVASVGSAQPPKGALPLCMAYTLAGIFTFGHFMHERYILPALMLILVAYIFYNERSLLWVFAGYSATILLNCLAAFYYSELFEYYTKGGYNTAVIFDYQLIKWCSLANVLLFALFTAVTLILIIENRPKRSYNG